MNIPELKAQCNDAYAQAIKLLEDNGERQAVCQNLLAAAELLVKISGVDFSEKAKCEAKARKLLDCVRRLRTGESFEECYFTLTGEKLVIIKPDEEEKAETLAPSAPADTVERGERTEAETMQPDLPSAKEILKNSPAKASKKMPCQELGEYRFPWDDLPKISFDDVAGLEDVKEAVIKKVLLPLKNPDLYDGYIKKNGGGLFLYGPPGTGKTMIAAAIAHEIGAKFCSIGASDLVLGGLGNSTKAIVELFREARSFPCSVIFFDEIESLCQVNTHAQHTREIRSELLRQIQGMAEYGEKSDKILFLIAATNKPWDVDPAFVRPGRFGTRIFVGLPDAPAREYIIKKNLEKIRSQGKVRVAEDIDYQKIIDATNGFNGADMDNLLDEVKEISIMRTASTGEKILTQADFETAMRKVTASVQKDDLQKLEKWKKENG